MLIEERRKKAIVLCGVLAIVLVIEAAYANGESLMFMAFLISTVTGILGIAIYLGDYSLMAGANTMSDEEIKKLDMDRVTSFMGLSMLAISIIVFFITIVSIGRVGTSESVIIMVVAYVAMIIAVTIHLATSKRFKA
ncbi:MAG: DUF3784 domain-containing protein [Candidatus Methanoplasma sp.]|jgi:hypothetical protein|nr:DUF3784 domain-containing protein [Candidatus Methanoplasma sp.]